MGVAFSILKREFLKARCAFRDLKVVNLGDEMKKVSFILITGVLLFISLCYQVNAQEYSENLTVYADDTPPAITILNPQLNETITQSFFWLNITTDENASCKYNLAECTDENCSAGNEAIIPFTYSDGYNHLEEINLNAYQKRATRKIYILNISCYDEFNNSRWTSITFDASFPNDPPY